MNEQAPHNGQPQGEPINLSKTQPQYDNPQQTGQNGAQPPVYGGDVIGSGQPPRQTKDNFALVSLICGILAVLTSCCFQSLMFPLVGSAITFGVLSIQKNAGDRRMAITGIVLGALSILFWIFSIVFTLLFSISPLFFTGDFADFFRTWEERFLGQ